MPSEEPPEKAVSTEVTLSVIDKLYASMIRGRDATTRLLLTEVLLSIALLALSIGIVSASKDISIAGIGFTMQLWVLLAAGAAAIPVLAVAVLTQLHRLMALTEEIADRYTDLGYDRKRLADPASSPFELPVLLMEVWVRWSRGRGRSSRLERFYFVVLLLSIALVLLVLPLAAQVAAGLEVSSAFDWRVWTWAPFIVLIIFTAGLLIAMIQAPPTIVAADAERHRRHLDARVAEGAKELRSTTKLPADRP